jgi:hypothetical protein
MAHNKILRLQSQPDLTALRPLQGFSTLLLFLVQDSHFFAGAH